MNRTIVQPASALVIPLFLVLGVSLLVVQSYGAPGDKEHPGHASRLAGPESSSIPLPQGKTQELCKRLSLAEFVKDPKKVASFRKGVKKMRSLPSRDPRSWTFQANIHWRPLFPLYVYQQAEKSQDPAQQIFRDEAGFTANPDVFNQCPHGNWWFLPWHRAYLYYFERILRWAAEDPSLTLPYWNYCDPAQGELPEIFRTAKVNGAANPLYLPELATFTDGQNQPQVFPIRNAALLRGELELTPKATNLKALDLLRFTNLQELGAETGFGGPRACDPMCGCGFGALEAVPHNRIHTAIGGSRAMAGGSLKVGFMGDPSTAARDPIFWVHHVNIDRLWASWASWKEGRHNPEDPRWLDRAFTFVDIDDKGEPKFIEAAVANLLTTEMLGYGYDRLEPVPVVVARAPSFLPATATDRSFQPLAAALPARKGGDHAPPGLAPGSGIQLTTGRSSTVAIPLLRGIRGDQVKELAQPQPAERKGQLLLSLEGVQLEHLPGVDYDVYLNLPAKAKPNPDSPYHVGTMTFFGARHPQGAAGQHKHAAPLYFKFAIGPELVRLLAADKTAAKQLQVTFVPVSGTQPIRGKANAPPPADLPGITIRQVRLLSVR
jgi:tyrosinase